MTPKFQYTVQIAIYSILHIPFMFDLVNYIGLMSAQSNPSGRKSGREQELRPQDSAYIGRA